jgi:tRNA (cytidine/uridine-2'-O-)-methyltransferase
MKGAETRPLAQVVLMGPRIAANTGAIGRSCVAVGAQLWLVRPLGFHLTDRHLRRAGLDYWEHLRWALVDHLDEAIAGGDARRVWYFETGARRSYTEVAYERGDMIVFGAEDRGLPETVRWHAESEGRLVSIPIRREARSLNLATSVAIALFEIARQIGEREPGA